MNNSPRGMGQGRTMRGFMQDPTVARHRLARDTVRRILAFARPYRGQLAIFAVLLVLDAAAGTAVPLLFRYLIDDGIARGDRGLVDTLAGVAVALALLTAVLSVAERLVSASVGEGLILDLRTVVFDHVQRMPLAFFARTRTGALVQRLNGDVLGAQQAFTSTLQTVVSNGLTITFTLAAMLAYMASEDPVKVSCARRELPPDAQGKPVAWPSCIPPQRRSPER
jgi:ATP-binding cassette subfamily B protein